MGNLNYSKNKQPHTTVEKSLLWMRQNTAKLFVCAILILLSVAIFTLGVVVAQKTTNNKVY